MTIRRRTVWYLHGFDPATTARYRRIFAAASARLGVALEDLPAGAEGWRVRRGATVTDIRYLRYDGLVRAWRSPPLWRRLLRGAVALAGYGGEGALRRLARRAPRLPGLAVAPYLAVAAPPAAAAAAFAWGPAAGLAAVAAALALALWLVRRSYLDIVADLFAWMRALARGEGQAGAYEARVREMAGEIIAGGEADEVLVVGHSLGGIGAIMAVAAVLEAAEAAEASGPEGRGASRSAALSGQGTAPAPAGEPGAAADGRDRAQVLAGQHEGNAPAAGGAGAAGIRRGRLALLTMGSTHGVVLAQRGTGREALARAVARIASVERSAAGGRGARGGVFWVDVSSPRDAFCLPLTDPLLLIGDAARPGMVSPRVLSARLRSAPRIPGDRRTVFGAMRRHMGYLLAPEPGSGFDYADAVTGPLSLAERFAVRGNSPRASMWQP